MTMNRPSPGDRLELVERGHDLRGVALRLDLRPDAGDAALRVDEERRPGRTHVRAAVVVLLDPRPVGLRRLVPLVGEERERQSELLAEVTLAGSALRADPPYV